MKHVPPHAHTACSPSSCSEQEAPNCPVCLDPVTEERTPSGAWIIDPGRAVQSLEWHGDGSPVMKHTYFCRDCVQKLLDTSNRQSARLKHPLTSKPIDLELLERLYNIPGGPVAVDRRPLRALPSNPVDPETPERLYNIPEGPVAGDPETLERLYNMSREPVAVDRRALSAWLSRLEAHATAHFHGSAVLFSCLSSLLRKAASAMSGASSASRDVVAIPVHGSFVPVARALCYMCWKKGKPLPDRAVIQHAQRMENSYDYADIEDVIETAGNLLARHCKSRLRLLMQSGRIPFSNVTDTVQHMRVGGSGWDLASTSRRLQPLQDGILLVLAMQHPPVQKAHLGCMESRNLTGHFLQYWAEGYLTPERVHIQNLFRYNPFVRADVVHRIASLTPQQAAADGMMPLLLRDLLTTAAMQSLQMKTRSIERTNSLVSPAWRFNLLDCARRMTVPAIDVL